MTEQFTSPPAEINLHGRPEGGIQEGTGRKGLGVFSIVFMVIAAAAPLTVVVTAYPLNILFSGSIGLPLFLVICALALLVFAVGFTRMSRDVSGGALYSFVAKGLGAKLGVGSAFLAIIGYIGAYIGLSAYIGVAISGLIDHFSGWDSPWWMWSLLAAAFVAFLGYRNVELGAKVLSVLLVAECAVVIILDVATWVRGGPQTLSGAPFSLSELTAPGAGIGIVLALGSYIGFEATVVFRSEARDPERTIPRATIISIIIIGVFYGLSSWAMIGGLGADDAVKKAAANPSGIVFALADQFAGPIISDIMQVLLVTSLIAAVLSFHNVIARYGSSLGSHGVLPKSLGVINPRHGAPSRSSAVLSIILFVALLLTIVFRLDPVTQVYGIISSTASIGIVVLLALTSLAVIVHFRRSRTRGAVWATLIAPAVAFLVLGALTVATVVYFPMVTGSAVVAWSICAALAIVFILGIIVAYAVGRRRPQALDDIAGRTVVADSRVNA